MKEIFSLLLVVLLCSTGVLAQSLNTTHAPVYSDPIRQIHASLSGTIAGKITLQKTISETSAKQHERPTFSPDTIWTYEEFREAPLQPFVPSSYRITFDIGQPNDFIQLEEQRFFDESSQNWYLSSKQSSYYKDQFLDSTVYRSYSQQGEWISGQRTTYLRNPQPGFTSEYYQETYRKETGWENGRHVAMYNNADSTVYWSREFLFDKDLGKYFLFQLLHTEDGVDFDLVESRRYNLLGIETWYKRFTRYDESLRISSQTEHRLNLTKTEAIPTDSTHYHYSGDESTAETFKYTDEMGWQLTHFTRTFSSFKNGGDEASIDSILTYHLILIEGEYVPGKVMAKTVNIYNDLGALSERHYYDFHSNPEHPLIEKLIYEYEFIAGEYHQTKESHMIWEDSIHAFYTSSIKSSEFNNEGVLFDYSILELSFTGDTTSFTKSQFFQTSEFEYSIFYDWDSTLRKLVRQGSRGFSNTSPVAQIVVEETDFGGFRALEVSNGYPAVINNGPLQIELGDTLHFYIKAFNPDLSIPKLVIDHLPATASFDNETHQFFWIVDELNPTPMIYTVTDNDLEYSTRVPFISGELAVGNEREMETPDQIKIFQNYPNPFNPETTIQFNLSSVITLSLKVFNIMGQEVATLLNKQTMSAGTHSVRFNASNLSSGIYYYQISTTSSSFTKSMMLIK